MRYIYNKVCAALLVLLALCACNGHGGLLPDSGGCPYEVVLVGDTDSILYRQLTACVPALPQAEPMFDVSCMPPTRLNATMRLARSIVVVRINPGEFSHTAIRYEKNVYAEPQMMVYVNTPSAERLQRDGKAIGYAVARLLARHETNATIATLQRRHNPKLEDDVRRMFGIEMRIPADMRASKRGKDFIWISNDSPTAMSNICIYASANRDSVMQANIKGETDLMHMATTKGSILRQTVREHGRDITVCRGLWEMSGDAMGGPFISHTIKGIGPKGVITAEAFVYAPGLKKRNILLQTEAALYTIKQENK